MRLYPTASVFVSGTNWAVAFRLSALEARLAIIFATVMTAGHLAADFVGREKCAKCTGSTVLIYTNSLFEFVINRAHNPGLTDLSVEESRGTRGRSVGYASRPVILRALGTFGASFMTAYTLTRLESFRATWWFVSDAAPFRKVCAGRTRRST